MASLLLLAALVVTGSALSDAAPQARTDIWVYKICTFDNDICDFEPDSGSVLNWQRLSRDDDNDAWFLNRRPGSLQGNKFLFLSFRNPESDIQHGQLTFRSPVYSPSPVPRDYCLRFWVTVHSSTETHFTIKALPVRANGSVSKLLDEFRGHMTNDWTSMEIDFNIADSFEISFFASVYPGSSADAGIAIDDYVLQSGKCLTETS